MLPVSAKENFFVREKDTEKKLVELWNGDDPEAFEEFYSQEIEEIGGFTPRLFSPEIGQDFRNEEDKLIVFTFTFDRKAMIESEYGEYYLEFEEENPDNLGSFFFSLISYDGTTYHSGRKNANARRVYSFKEIIKDCGVEDPAEIGLARYERLSEYGLFTFEFADYTPGWNEIDGNRYYIKSDGTVLTKSAMIDGIRYKFDESGVCQGKYTGYTMTSKGKRYWKNGELVKNKWIKVKGERKHYADKNGYLVTGTRKIDGKKYSFDENGALKKMPEKKEFPRIEVKYPDGAVYESSDGGKSWTKDGEVQSPSVYARFKGEYPVRMSEDAMIVVRNEALPFLSSGEDQLFREENGEWIKPELLDKEMGFAGLVYAIEEKQECGFAMGTSYYVPLEGKYRYTLKMIGPGGNEYMISVEFWAVDDTVSE